MQRLGDPPKLATFAYAPLWSSSLRQPTKHCKHQRLALEIVDLGVFGARKNLDPMLLRHWGVWGGIKVVIDIRNVFAIEGGGLVEHGLQRLASAISRPRKKAGLL